MTDLPTRAALEAALDRADADYRAAATDVARGNAKAQARMPALWTAIGAAKDALRDFDAVAEERHRLAEEHRRTEEAQDLRDAVAASEAAVEEIPGEAATLVRQIEEIVATVNRHKVLVQIALSGMRSGQGRHLEDRIRALENALGDFESGLAGLLCRALPNLSRVDWEGQASLMAIYERESGRTWAQASAHSCQRAVAMLRRQLPPEPQEAA